MHLFPLGIIIFHKPHPGVAGIDPLQISVSLSSMGYSCISAFSEFLYFWKKKNRYSMTDKN